MKTHVTLTPQKSRLMTSRITQQFLFGIFMIVTVGLHSISAQTSTNKEINVIGMVSDEIGPLTGVNIKLKGQNVGAITDKDGTFIFPKALQVDDVLIFSYLGYETQNIIIKADTKFINVTLEAVAIDIVGALAVDKPYKSKRTF